MRGRWRCALARTHLPITHNSLTLTTTIGILHPSTRKYMTQMGYFVERALRPAAAPPVTRVVEARDNVADA